MPYIMAFVVLNKVVDSDGQYCIIPPPQKKTQLSCKTNLESVLLMSSSQFCPSHLYLAQPRCFFCWRPQWGEVLKPEAFSSSTPRQVEIMEALMNTVT